MTLMLFLAAAVSDPGASHEALALTQARHARPSVLLGGERTEGQMAAVIAGRLLHTLWVSQGSPCDPAVAACKHAADRFALEAARSLEAEQERAAVELLAEALDEHLKPPQMRRLSAFAGTPEGQGLVAALFDYDSPVGSSPGLRQKYSALMLEMAKSKRPAIQARFYEATKDLPRGRFMVPPPPPLRTQQ